ncbi:MAG TPA: tyrosine--tRNA ligase [Acidimicrobiales bacterium]|nr:tyrosine--tRNA ligase [Acidimicrobiales bacterium]
MVPLTEDLAFRGLVYQHSDDALLRELDHGHLTAYIGFDPSSDSLHVGNLLQLTMLRRMQLASHRPIALLGGGTGFIGDPGGKTEERALLTPEQHARNVAGIAPQLERFLDFSPAAGAAQAVLLDNADWLLSLSLVEFLRDTGKHFSVNQMIAKESVRARIERPEHGISYTEFSYMLLQAYDFLHLFDGYGCTLQMGGSDQWGNITMGVELIRKARGATAYALTSPLVTRPDGTKFGKSESGAIYLDPGRTSPYKLYQYFVRAEDSVVGRYLRYFTFLDHGRILEADRATAEHPERREAQRLLAREMCTLVHGDQETARVERAVAALYSEDVASLDEETLLMVVADAPSTTLARSALDGDGLELVDVLVSSGLVSSKTQARTTISQGGVYVDNRREQDPAARLTGKDLLAGRYVLLRRGRRDLHLLCFA